MSPHQFPVDTADRRSGDGKRQAPAGSPANVDRPQANVETVQAIYAAFAKGDVPAILAKLREDVDWEPGYAHNDDIPWLKSGRGRDHVASFFTELQGFSVNGFDVRAIVGDGEWVVALIAVDLVWNDTGRRIVEDGEVHVWRFDKTGMVKSMRHAVDTRQHAHALHPL